MNKIALAPTSLPNTPPLEHIDAAMEAEYDGIGIRLFRSPGIQYAFHPVVGDQALMRDVKRAIAGTALDVLDVLSFYLQPEMDLESMLAPLEFGAKIGAKYTLVIGDDPGWARMVDNFGRFCDAAAQLGLTAVIEAPVVQRQVNTLPRALQLIAESSRENAVIGLDPFQFLRAGHSVDVLKGQDARLFPYSQLDDGVDTVPAPGGGCAPGEGAVPLRGILDILPAGLPLSLEWAAPSRSTYSAAEWAKIALEGARRFLEQYCASKN